MRSHCNSQITSDCWPTISNPSHPSPPPRPGTPPPLHAPSLITFFDINYWQIFLLKTLFRLHSFFGVTFAHFRNTSLPKNVQGCFIIPSLPNENFKISLFSAFHYCIYPLLNPCHANYLCLRNKTPLPPFSESWYLL